MNGRNHLVDFSIGDGRADGEAELFGVNALRDGQRKRVPLPVAFLLVGRDRVMYQSLDSPIL